MADSGQTASGFVRGGTGGRTEFFNGRGVALRRPDGAARRPHPGRLRILSQARRSRQPHGAASRAVSSFDCCSVGAVRRFRATGSTLQQIRTLPPHGGTCLPDLFRVVSIKQPVATMTNSKAPSHRWGFFRAGGFDQVRLESGRRSDEPGSARPKIVGRAGLPHCRAGVRSQDRRPD